MELLLPGIFGLLGGLVRASIGILKYSTPKKSGKFRSFYLFLTLLSSAIIGLFAGLLFSAPTAYVLPFLAGYAGTDFIEGMYKIRMKGSVKI